MARPEEPNDISIKSTVPCDFKVYFKGDEDEITEHDFLYDGGFYQDNIVLFSNKNNVMVCYYYDDSDCEWLEHEYFAVMERANGLNYFNNQSWERLPDNVQEAYTSFVADGILLAEEPSKKTTKKSK